jgi:ATP-dependent DNA helicase DinG
MKNIWMDLLGPQSLLAKKPFYEFRKDQVELASTLSEIFEGSGIILAEAGTGTGKSLAYLLPAVSIRQRVVIATHTKALQDQLAEKDIPLASEIMGRRIDALKVKGKANYLCLFHYDKFRKNPLFRDPEEIKFYQAVEAWIPKTEFGDRSELSDLPEELDFWNDVNARPERCSWSRCPLFQDCYLLKLKKAAEVVDIIITNHHLLFADISVRAKGVNASVLPDFLNLVIDEAHEAEESATSFFGVTVSKRVAEEWLNDCAREVKSSKVRKPAAGHYAVESETREFFGNWMKEGDKRRLNREDYKKGSELLPGFSSKMIMYLKSLENELDPDVWLGLGERAEVLIESLNFIFSDEEPQYVKSVETRGKNVVLNASPILVGPMLRKNLFEQIKSGVLTSATLSVNGSFDYLKKRLGVPSNNFEMQINSPFDYASQGLFYLPEVFPEPMSKEFIISAVETVDSLVLYSKGRAFILCTSIKNMNAIYESLKGTVPYPLFLQGEKPKNTTLEEFREAGNGVLVATSSFWQGVDVQGEALSLVVIDKIPFASPGDPIVEARIEEIRQRGEDPFSSYQLPMAAMTLKQGMGRLIRSKKDRGVVACLDIRLRRKGYGKRIIQSLPPFPLTSDLQKVKAFFEEK